MFFVDGSEQLKFSLLGRSCVSCMRDLNVWVVKGCVVGEEAKHSWVTLSHLEVPGFERKQEKESVEEAAQQPPGIKRECKK